MPKTPGKPPLSIVSDATTGIRPPRKLGQHGLALWSAVMSEFHIEDRGGVELLCLACQALDRAEALAAAIERDGHTIYSRTGVPRTHPSIKDELALRAFIAKTIERLGISVEAVKPPGRPPGRGSWPLVT